jgi:hypothetical protein
MRQLTDKQLLKLDAQISALSFKLSKVCKQHKIAEKNDELVNVSWSDWDAYDTQEGIINALHNIDKELDNLSYYITQINK